jgi:hypothetical protein
MIQSLKKYMENYEKIVGFLGMRYPIFFYLCSRYGNQWFMVVNID